MIEVYHDIFVGDLSAYQRKVAGQVGWAVVHACKDPYHREFLGYTGRAAPKDHPEYFTAKRGNRLVLNLVDVPNPEFFRTEMINQAMDFIDEVRAAGLKVLIHCNQGESRSPSLALLYMAARLRVLPTESLAAAETAFRPLYPMYNPKPGIREHLLQNWDQYCGEGVRSRGSTTEG